jgi:hypothetical protein
MLAMCCLSPAVAQEDPVCVSQQIPNAPPSNSDLKPSPFAVVVETKSASTASISNEEQSVILVIRAQDRTPVSIEEVMVSPLGDSADYFNASGKCTNSEGWVVDFFRLSLFKAAEYPFLVVAKRGSVTPEFAYQDIKLSIQGVVHAPILGGILGAILLTFFLELGSWLKDPLPKESRSQQIEELFLRSGFLFSIMILKGLYGGAVAAILIALTTLNQWLHEKLKTAISPNPKGAKS